MNKPKYRHALPQLGSTQLLTDGGLETTLIFHTGIELPYFAAFTLLSTAEGRAALQAYYEQYINAAHEQGVGFILDSPTWRASQDWGDLLGYSTEAMAQANRAAIDLLLTLREAHERRHAFLVSGNLGPKGDGYAPETLLTEREAEDYHQIQIATFDLAGVDMISAITMTHAEEAIGIARACKQRDLPLALAFTVETDGRLPSGQPLADAINQLDSDAATRPAYFMINCAHPEHFSHVLEPGAEWTQRIRGLRANASRLSHAELDACETLDEGDPDELGREHAELLTVLPNLRVFGGCCGTDHRHVTAIAKACMAAA